MALPRTLGELQLYRVLQRANLLLYYDTFIQQGGDDVQQLCEAGEDEFLEIMALVGMATKPLHVRRLQKALRDWAANPALFSTPLGPVAPCAVPLLRVDGSGCRRPGSDGSPCERDDLAPLRDLSPRSPCSQGSPAAPELLSREKLSPMDPRWLGPELYTAELEDEHPVPPLPFACHPRPPGPATPTSSCSSSSASPWPGGQLDPDTTRALEDSVDRLLRTIPQADPAEVKTLLRLNKKMAKTVGHIFSLEPQDKSKEEEIRKYSLIYGRFDSKRREGKQLTHHEMLINEAAAQFCIRDNALLLRRVELFSLARQVARECAYTSTFKHNRTFSDDCTASVDCTAQKRLKLDGSDSRDAGANSDVRSTADDNSLSGESLDSLTPDASSSPRPLSDPSLLSWSRTLMQQTLMDEGLRLARMVSRDHASRLSLGSEKRQISEPEESRSGLRNRSASPGHREDP